MEQSLLWSLLSVTVRPEVVEVFPVTNTPLNTKVNFKRVYYTINHNMIRVRFMDCRISSKPKQIES